jgi:hypothetical protein
VKPDVEVLVKRKLHTGHSESIQTPSLFPHFVPFQLYSKMYPQIYTQSIANNDKAKTGVELFAKN